MAILSTLAIDTIGIKGDWDGGFKEIVMKIVFLILACSLPLAFTGCWSSGREKIVVIKPSDKESRRKVGDIDINKDINKDIDINRDHDNKK